MDIKKTKLYKEVKKGKTKGIISIPFKVDTGIKITKDNIDHILDSEVIIYNKKINMLKKENIDFPVDKNFEKKLRKNLENNIGKNKLDLKFIYVNSESIDDAIEKVERSKEFVEWCVD